MRPLSSVDTETVVSSIQAMRHTELLYRPVDYFYRFQQEMSLHNINNNNNSNNEDDYSLPSPNYGHVDLECRSKMCDWCAQIVDHCQFHRETVWITMNLLDRFMAASTTTTTPMGTTNTILKDRGMYQLAAMTCLYTAIKIHEPIAISAGSMANLSKGVHSQRQLEDMESTLLGFIQWRVYPVTPLSYCHYLCELLHPDRGLLEQLSSVVVVGVGTGDTNKNTAPNKGLNDVTRETLLELARMQTELAVKEYPLCLEDASTIAYAAILNSIQCMDLPCDLQEHVGNLLALALGIDGHSSHLQDVQIRLYQAITGVPNAPVTPLSSTTASDICAEDELMSPIARPKDILLVGSPRSVAVTGVQ
jgi:Cyclin, N-terminal domain